MNALLVATCEAFRSGPAGSRDRARGRDRGAAQATGGARRRGDQRLRRQKSEDMTTDEQQATVDALFEK